MGINRPAVFAKKTVRPLRAGQSDSGFNRKGAPGGAFSENLADPQPLAMYWPPLMVMTAPVMKAAASDAR